MSIKVTERISGLRKAMMLSALFFSLFFCFTACKKTGELTPAFSEGDLNARYTDTITVRTTTLYDDSIRTDETSRSLFGVFNDPVFGITKASFYTQTSLSTTDLQFPAGAVMDSMVLELTYDKYYGRSGQSIKLQVFELSEALSIDEDYYSYSTLGILTPAVGIKTFVPDLTDTLSSDTTNYVPKVRVKLDQAFADKIFNHGSFSSNEEFIEFFKGFHVMPDTTSLPAPGEGVIVNFNILSSTSNLLLYYHFPSGDGGIQNEEYEFAINSGSSRFSHFSHDYSGTPIPAAVQNQQAEVSYIQPMGGLTTRIEFPYLESLTRERNITVNKAELLITVNAGSNDEFAAPDRLVALSRNEEGENVFLPDFFEGTEYFGGNLDINSQTYRFNIARYIDQLINEKSTSEPLYLIVSGSAVTANRLILNSGKHPTAKIKLRLTFTQL